MSRTLDPSIQYSLDGEPVVGGKAYYGVANQDPKLNPIAIYDERTLGGLPLINPQDTDAQGRVFNSVYVGVNEYSFLVEDSLGNQLISEPLLEPLNTLGLVTQDGDMNGFKFINVADAVLNNQFATLGQVSESYSITVSTSGGSTANAIQASMPISPLSLIDNQRIIVQILHGANTIVNPTFKLNSFTAKRIYRGNSENLIVGDTKGPSNFLHLAYSAAIDSWCLLNTDDQGIITDNINMDGYRHENVADPILGNQYQTAYLNAQKQVGNVGSAGGVNALTATVPYVDTLSHGLQVRIKKNTTGNTIGTPTFNLNGLGAKTIYRALNGGAGVAALRVGDTATFNNWLDLVYNSNLDQWLLLNPHIMLDEQFAAGTISGTIIADNSITALQLGENSVGASEIAEHAVGRSEIADGAVHTEQLDTTNVTMDFSITIGGTAHMRTDRQIVVASQYGFNARTEMDPTGNSESSFFCFSGLWEGGFGLDNWITLVNMPSGIGGTFLMDARAAVRYVNASAPWNMGHGDIALFIYLRVNKEGKVTGACVSPTPTWGYNGKTSIEADRVSAHRNERGEKIGVRKYKNIIDPDSEIIIPPWKGGDPAKWDLDKFTNPEMVEVEIDHEMKNRDMNDIPHPFMTLEEGDTVVLIDPCSKIADDLAVLHDMDEGVGKLFKTGYLEITDPVDVCVKPIGVEVVGARWKS